MSDDALAELESTPASEFKKSGWRGVHERLRSARHGALLVKNHRRSEAVLLTTDEYARLLRLADSATRTEADAMAELRQRFDERLAGLRERGASDRLRDFATQPLELDQTVHPGDSR